MPRRIGALIAVVVVAAILLGALDWVSDVLFTPWALAKPPLLAEWVGRLTTGNGEPRGVYLALERADRASDGASECHNCSHFKGTIETCDQRGKRLRYDVSGRARDRHATSLYVGASPATRPPPDGLELSVMKGKWDGANRLDFKTEFFWRRGKSAISSTDDAATQPVPLIMERRNHLGFEVVCQQIANRR